MSELPDHLKFQRYSHDRVLGSTARDPDLSAREAPDRELLKTKIRQKLGNINDLLKEEKENA